MAYDIPSQEGSYAQDEEGSEYGETPNKKYDNVGGQIDEEARDSQEETPYSEGILDNEQSFHDEIR
jgi:hypothetical protein